MVKGWGTSKNIWAIVSFVYVLHQCVTASDQSPKPQIPDFGGYVVFDMVSFNRIQDRQAYVRAILDEQAACRRNTTVGLSVIALLTLISGGVYGYYQYTKPVQPRQVIPANPHRKSLEERYWEKFEEAHTFKGAIKNGLRNGFAYAIASMSMITAMALFEKMGLLSWKRIKNAFYPTTAAFCAEQEEFLKNYSNFLYNALQDFEYQLTKAKTAEEFEEYMKWRGLVSVEMQTSISALVHAVEDFAALSFEFMARKAMQVPQDKLPVQKFTEMAEWIDQLTNTLNSFILLVEGVVNATTLEQLGQHKVSTNMAFKNAVHVARNTAHSLQLLIDTV
ncbi:hypothetical protein FJ364_03170 [Candidatus Dependentiae bacterium]|nr:hypothetical protein [Candidatus Dependentiae bacterium]